MRTSTLDTRFRLRTAALAALGAIAAAGCGGRDEAPESAAAPVAVHTTPVRAADEARVVDAVGSLRSTRQATLAGKVMGTVTEIRKEAGDPVRRGEVLVVVDARDVAGQVGQAEGALAQARAAAVLAETNFQRFEQLHARGSASRLELDQARYQYETARGAVSQAEGALATARSYESYAEIAAPFDGRVVDRRCEIGDLASPGRPLLVLEDATRLRLDVTLPEAELGSAAVGAPVRVRVPSLGDRMLQGRVAAIVPAVDPATRTFLVKIDLPGDPALRSGLYAHALFEAAPRRVLRVPAAAIVRRGGLTGALVDENGRATFRLLTLADDAGDPVEVLAGLGDGERLIVSPPADLAEGAAVSATAIASAPGIGGATPFGGATAQASASTIGDATATAGAPGDSGAVEEVRR